MVERDVCNWGIVHVHANTRAPDPQGCDRRKPPSSEMEKEQIAKGCGWNRPAIDHLNFLPVLHQREFQLPGLFPALDSMAEGDPNMGQVVLGGVIVGRDQQTSWKRGAGELGQTEMVTDSQLDFTFDR